MPKTGRSLMARLSAAGAEVDDTEGARVSAADGWWLLCAPDARDVLVARTEAQDLEGLDRLVAQLPLSGLGRGAQAAR